jgi:hypothetical protein
VLFLVGWDARVDHPPPAAQTVRLQGGAVALVGRPRTSCSSGVVKPGIDGDVWCAFSRAAGDNTELWVLNVSRATHARVPCDGSSPLCLRLTTNLWTGDPLFSLAHPEIHGFEGDTLFLYDDARSATPDDAYKGPIKAWRPGWPTARSLTSDAGYICHGHPWAAAAYCVDNVATVAGSPEFDLRAGSLAGGAAGGILMSVGRIRALGSAGQVMWGAAFSPDGQSFLYSSPAEGEDVEVLKMAATTDGGTAPAVEILRNGGRWQIAPDGKKLYYLASYSYAETDGSGTLSMIDLPPAGVPATVIQDHVGAYASLGSFGEPHPGLAYLQDVTKGNGTFRLLRDRSQPALTTTLGSDVNEFLVSPDLRYTYLSQPDAPGGPVGLLASNDGAGTCALNTREGVGLYSVTFPPQASTVFWAQDSESGFEIEGWYATSAGCADKRRFSENLASLQAVRGGILFADSDPDRQTMSLKRATLDRGTLGEAESIFGGIDTSLARGGTKFVVFTVSQGESPGLYAYGPLP